MKLIKKRCSLSVPNRSLEHDHYWMLDENIEVPPRVLEFTIETLSSAYSLYPLLYQLATKAESIIELGIGWGKSTNSMLWGLKNGKQGHLWSIDCGNIHTDEAVAKIKSLDIAKYFTWVKKDFFTIPDEWFKEHKTDLVFIDFNPKRLRPEFVYKSIYPEEPHLDRKNIKRDCRIMMDKLLLSMKRDGLLVMKPYCCDTDVYKMAKEGLIEIVFEYKQDLRFIILRKKQ